MRQLLYSWQLRIRPGNRIALKTSRRVLPSKAIHKEVQQMYAETPDMTAVYAEKQIQSAKRMQVALAK